MTRKEVLEKIEELLLKAEEGVGKSEHNNKVYATLEIVEAYRKLLEV